MPGEEPYHPLRNSQYGRAFHDTVCNVPSSKKGTHVAVNQQSVIDHDFSYGSVSDAYLAGEERLSTFDVQVLFEGDIHLRPRTTDINDSPFRTAFETRFHFEFVFADPHRFQTGFEDVLCIDIMRLSL